MLFKLFNVVLLASSACAAIIPNINPFTNIHSRAAGDKAAKMLADIAPAASACTPANPECATADHAAPFLVKAFMDYKITNVHEMAAVLSLMAFETADFKYNIHHFPSLTPGQGTRNMQSATYNYDYASSIPELKDKVAAIGGTRSALTPDQANKVMALVLSDDYTWASAAWFLTIVCTGSVRKGLQAGGQAGWEAYLTQCVQAPASGIQERLPKWTLANRAFGIS